MSDKPDCLCMVWVSDKNSYRRKRRFCRNKAIDFLPNGVPACWMHVKWPNVSMSRTEPVDEHAESN